ncbi:unnamed protein product [Closterium sp. NIES-54]
MAEGTWGLPTPTGDAGLEDSSLALIPRGADLTSKTYAGYRKRTRTTGGGESSAPTREAHEQDKQTGNHPPAAAMEISSDEPATTNSPAAAVNLTSFQDTPVVIPEPFKGWALKAVRDFRKDFKALLKARSKLKKMKTLNEQGVILHSIRTKAVEFQTKYPQTRERSAASVASVHHENQMRIQQDFIKSKELEVEEILAASSSHLTALATKTEDYIKSLTTDPELTVSDAAKERFRKIKGQCIEKAKSEVSNARDELVIRELVMQKEKEAEDLKKAAAAEEMEHMETDPAIDELIQKATKEYGKTLRKEITASVEAKLTAKFKKNLSMGPQDPKPAPASTKPKADPSKDQKFSGTKADVPKATRKRGKTKKKVKSQGGGRGKGQEASSTKAQVPKNGGGGPGKGPRKN